MHNAEYASSSSHFALFVILQQGYLMILCMVRREQHDNKQTDTPTTYKNTDTAEQQPYQHPNIATIYVTTTIAWHLLAEQWMLAGLGAVVLFLLLGIVENRTTSEVSIIPETQRLWHVLVALHAVWDVLVAMHMHKSLNMLRGVVPGIAGMAWVSAAIRSTRKGTREGADLQPFRQWSQRRHHVTLTLLLLVSAMLDFWASVAASAETSSANIITAILLPPPPLFTSLVKQQGWHYVVAFVLGYGMTSIGEHMVHQNIYHGGWAFIQQQAVPGHWSYPFVVFFQGAYRHHWLMHHRHAQEDPSYLRRHGDPSPKQKKASDEQFANAPILLAISQYGMGGGPIGFLHVQFLLLTTPVYYVMYALWSVFGWYPALAYYAPCLLFGLSSTGYHRYLHMDLDVARKRTPWYFRPFVLTEEGRQLSRDHYTHHYGGKVPGYYSHVIPFARYITVPIFGQ